MSGFSIVPEVMTAGIVINVDPVGGSYHTFTVNGSGFDSTTMACVFDGGLAAANTWVNWGPATVMLVSSTQIQVTSLATEVHMQTVNQCPTPPLATPGAKTPLTGGSLTITITQGQQISNQVIMATYTFNQLVPPDDRA